MGRSCPTCIPSAVLLKWSGGGKSSITISSISESQSSCCVPSISSLKTSWARISSASTGLVSTFFKDHLSCKPHGWISNFIIAQLLCVVRIVSASPLSSLVFKGKNLRRS